MQIADILVCIDASAEGRQRMRVAMSLASRFGAWVTGYYVSPTQGVFEGVPNAASDLRAPPEMEEVSAGDVAEEVLAEFEDGLKSKGLGGSWILGERSADLSDLVARARCVDLVVAALAPLPGYPADLQPIDIDPVVVGCGRPVLGLPLANLPEKIGSDVVIAWDGSREAARAVHDALPFLRLARSVRIVSLHADKASAGGAEQILAHLHRHRVPAAIDANTTLSMDTPEDEILARLQIPEADLLIAGAFGHSRIRERLFGGASRTFLHQMMIPVLVSH